MTLLDVEHGVTLVGMAPTGSGTQSEHASRLWLTVDGRRWRDVTPAAARRADPSGGFAWFEAASFLDPRTGWVTTWNTDNLGVTVYGTSDAGQHWRVVGRSSHNLSAGSTTLIQLVSPLVGTMDTLQPNGPTMSLQVTTDGGRTWRVMYGGPPPRASGEPLSGPFGTAFAFVSSRRGFAADGIPPTFPSGGLSADLLYRTGDGGRQWTRQRVPFPSPPPRCPVDGSDALVCLVSLPELDSSGTGALATEVLAGSQATVGFDRTTDGGRTWTPASSFRMTLAGQTSSDGTAPPVYPLVSLPGPGTWWVLAPTTTTGLTCWTTSSQGRSWQRVGSVRLPGTPAALQATDARHAWVTVSVTRGEGSHRVLYATDDAGHSWHPVTPTDH